MSEVVGRPVEPIHDLHGNPLSYAALIRDYGHRLDQRHVAILATRGLDVVLTTYHDVGLAFSIGGTRARQIVLSARRRLRSHHIREQRSQLESEYLDLEAEARAEKQAALVKLASLTARELKLRRGIASTIHACNGDVELAGVLLHGTAQAWLMTECEAHPLIRDYLLKLCEVESRRAGGVLSQNTDML